MKNVNLKGKKFNSLMPIKIVGRDIDGSIKWLCKCDCGNTTIVPSYRIKNGVIRSCGCAKQKHGLSRTQFYHCWSHIIQRCNKSNTKYYSHYGGRGITVCDKWLNFKGFMDDMYQSYQEHVLKHSKKNTTLDRIDNDGNYCNENCRWATRQEQSVNRRNNVFVMIKGEKLTLSECSKKYNISDGTIRKRYKTGRNILTGLKNSNPLVYSNSYLVTTR